jgi:hypothetical protein
VASDYAIEFVPFNAVQLRDAFWAPRLATNRAVTIPTIWQRCEETARIEHFERAAAALRGEAGREKTPPWLPFDDSDVYKIIEATSYALSVSPAPKLAAYVDTIIAKIAAAQEPDGYLYTTRTSAPDAPHPWSGLERWAEESDVGHELYDLGHLYEAAVAHQRATGKNSLLQIAIRAAELLLSTFGPGKRSIWPGHQGIELGLVKLYRATGERRYLELAHFFLEERGPDGKPRSGVEYNQSHARVADQSEAVGHAVHATYMYAGMADVAALTGTSDYIRALDRIWEDLVAHKLYVTGGIGARAAHEGFGPADDLPNSTAFNETCAAVGLVYFCERMFRLHGHAGALDVLERVLYNSLLAGVSLDGKTFFYENPLECAGRCERSPWFECACCPGNLARLLASLPGYLYAHRGGTVYVNLFAASSAELTLNDGRQLTLVQETRYPWDGTVALTLTPPEGALTLKIRVPGWAREQPVPSDLYRFCDEPGEEPTLSLNGEPVPIELCDGYLTLERSWRTDDRIELTLPMPVRRVIADGRVAADRGCLALARGPLVYALEGVDHSPGDASNLLIAEDARLHAIFRPELLGGVVAITGKATRPQRAATDELRPKPIAFTAIPYYAWANRGPSEMRVWIPREG